MRNIYRNFFFLIFFTFQINALHAATTHMSGELDTLLAKAKQLEGDKKYNEAVTIYQEALTIASDLKLDEDTSFIYTKIGTIYYNKKDFKTAKNYFLQSIQSETTSIHAANANFNIALIHKKEKDSVLKFLGRSLETYNNQKASYEKFKTFSKAGILYKKHNEYHQAMKYLLQAYKGFESLDKEEELASVCRNIAVIQRLFKRYDIATNYYRKALELWTKSGKFQKISDGHNSLANIYKEQLKSDSAIFHYKKAIALREQLGVKKELGRIWHNLGTMYYSTADYPSAKNSYLQALQLKKETKDTVSIPVTYNELALIAIDEEQHVKANTYLETTKNYIDTHSNKNNKLRYYFVKSRYYERSGNYEQSLLYYKKYEKLERELFYNNQNQLVQRFQEELETYKKEQEIKELTVNNSTQKEVILKQRTSIIYISSLLAFVLITSFIVYLYFKQQQKINAQQQELDKLAATYQGQESIKESISKDLHDIITTSYDGIRLKILALSQAKEYDKISTSIIDEIKDVNHQIRLISHRLSPLHSKIQEATLTEIIVSQLSEFQYYRKVFVKLQLPLPALLDTMKLEDQTNFYGVFLEAMHNIEKHSQATEVEISHRITETNILEFDIADNGIGFSDSTGNGIGITNMKQRMSLLNGTLAITNTKEGTIVRISLKLIS
ncbi:tetratricopeptide repeat protein [Kordia sp.]|uniref:ATP-binding protein n=1 Tax=Kordia sp. TaxID=1965332 RepID=UPI003B597E78